MAKSNPLADTTKYGEMRRNVIAKLGEPLSSKALEAPPVGQQGPCVRDGYKFKGKVPDRVRADNYAMLGILTGYLSELVLTPVEAVRYAKESLQTHDISITYCTTSGELRIAAPVDYSPVKEQVNRVGSDDVPR